MQIAVIIRLHLVAPVDRSSPDWRHMRRVERLAHVLKNLPNHLRLLDEADQPDVTTSAGARQRSVLRYPGDQLGPCDSQVVAGRTLNTRLVSENIQFSPEPPWLDNVADSFSGYEKTCLATGTTESQSPNRRQSGIAPDHRENFLPFLGREGGSQIANLLRIGVRFGVSADNITTLKLVLLLGGFAAPNEKLPFFSADSSAYKQHLSKVRVTWRTEGSHQADSPLTAHNNALPFDLLGQWTPPWPNPTVQAVQAPATA